MDVRMPNMKHDHEQKVMEQNNVLLNIRNLLQKQVGLILIVIQQRNSRKYRVWHNDVFISFKHCPGYFLSTRVESA